MLMGAMIVLACFMALAYRQWQLTTLLRRAFTQHRELEDALKSLQAESRNTAVNLAVLRATLAGQGFIDETELNLIKEQLLESTFTGAPPSAAAPQENESELIQVPEHTLLVAESNEKLH